MTDSLKITVAALTRRRPRMLQALLTSFGKMALPSDCTVTCLIVENDDTDATRAIVEAADPLPNGLRVRYVLETEAGIPFGRNRAAKEAIAQGSDLLTFIDDDETVDSQWLVEIVARYRETGAQLIGGPVLIAPPSETLTPLQRAWHADLTAHYEKLAHTAIGNAAEGRAAPVTNNWLGETSVFSRHDLWFDDTLRFTGGSDSRFLHTARDMGLKLDWAQKAVVYADMSPDRLSFAVQWREAHSRTINRLRLGQVNKHMYWLRLPFGIVIKLISALVLALGLPFTKGRGILKLSRAFGLITGRVAAAFGANSRLYTRIFGN